MIKQFFLFFCLISFLAYSQEKASAKTKENEESFIRDRVYFSFGGEMLFLTMSQGSYNRYYQSYLNSPNAYVKKEFNLIGGGGYVGGSYLVADHFSTGGLLSVYSVPGVDVNRIEFNQDGETQNHEMHIKRNYFTFGHEFEAFAWAYQKTPFNIGFLLYTGAAFLLETRGLRINKVFVETENIFGGASFVVAPSLRFHIRMNKQGEVQIGYRHVMMIDRNFFHFGTAYFGLSYTVEFQKQKEREHEFNERMRELKKKNV